MNVELNSVTFTGSSTRMVSDSTADQASETCRTSPPVGTTISKPALHAATDSPRRDATRLWRFRTPALTATLWIGYYTAVAAGIWFGVLKEHYLAKRFGVVVPGKVYRSGQISPWKIESTLRTHQIGTIIDLTGIDPGNERQRREGEVAHRLQVPIYRYPLMGDGTGQIDRYADALERLVQCERANEPVLIHCAAGAQRTGASVAFYRVLIRKEPPGNAYRELMAYNWSPKKHRVLLDYVNGNMQTLAERLVERGVIDKVPHPLPLLQPDA